MTLQEGVREKSCDVPLLPNVDANVDRFIGQKRNDPELRMFGACVCHSLPPHDAQIGSCLHHKAVYEYAHWVERQGSVDVVSPSTYEKSWFQMLMKHQIHIPHL